MSAAALPPPPSRRRPPRPHDTAPAFALALVMHGLLVAALFVAVRWKTQEPAPVVAELWVSTPTPVVPVPAPPPPPPPPPREEAPPEPPKPHADIVTKDEKKEPPKKVEPKKEEKKAPPKKDEPKKDLIADLLKKQEAQTKAEREALRKAEADRMDKLMQQAAAPGQEASPGSGRSSAEYGARLKALIRPRIEYNVPAGTTPDVYAEVQVEVLPDGSVVAVRFLKQSGQPGYDAAVERAIRRTDPFPRKPDGSAPDRTIVIKFFPVEPQN